MESQQITILPSSALTATTNGDTIYNKGAREARIFINVTAVSGTTPSMIITLQAQDGLSGQWFTVQGAATSAITGVGKYTIEISPNMTTAAGANLRVGQLLPTVFRLAYSITGTTPSFTMSIGCELYV